MDTPDSRNEDDDVFFDAFDVDVFFDALDDCTGEDPTEPSLSDSTLCGPDPVPDEPRNWHSKPPTETSSTGSTFRRRSILRRSSAKEATGSGFGSSNDPEVDLVAENRRSFRQRRYNIHRNLKEDEYVVEKCDSTQEQVSSFPAPSEVREVNNEESTITTAANEDTDRAYDSANSALESGESSSDLLELIAGLVIKAIGFQINLFIVFLSFPIMFIYHTCMFFIDPFRTMRRGKDYLMWVVSRLWGVLCGWISPSVHAWFKEHKTIWKVALPCLVDGDSCGQSMFVSFCSILWFHHL